MEHRQRTLWDAVRENRLLWNNSHPAQAQEAVRHADLDTLQPVMDSLVSEGLINGWWIGGGTALSYHFGAVGTLDIDVFITLPGSTLLYDLGPVYRHLASGYGVQPEGEMLRFGSVFVQLLPADASDGIIPAACDDPLILPNGIRLFRAEYLIAVMLRLNSPKYRPRLREIRRRTRTDDPRLIRVLTRFGLLPAWDRVE